MGFFGGSIVSQQLVVFLHPCCFPPFVLFARARERGSVHSGQANCVGIETAEDKGMAVARRWNLHSADQNLLAITI
jgi:hypothetical protein